MSSPANHGNGHAGGVRASHTRRDALRSAGLAPAMLFAGSGKKLSNIAMNTGSTPLLLYFYKLK